MEVTWYCLLGIASPLPSPIQERERAGEREERREGRREERRREGGRREALYLTQSLKLGHEIQEHCSKNRTEKSSWKLLEVTCDWDSITALNMLTLANFQPEASATGMTPVRVTFCTITPLLHQGFCVVM